MDPNIAFETLESDTLPINRGRLIKTLADSTIRGVLDAVVELVTNCDDEYVRGESLGLDLSGRIEISIERGDKNFCTKIQVSDEATGMDHNQLKKSIEFSSITSGFKEGKSVRGFMGRGYKEAIIALGKGEIITLKDGVLSRAEIYYDDDIKDVRYNLAIPVKNLTPEELLDLGFSENSGTIVRIFVTNPKKNYIPSKNALADQIENHFSLRDINSSDKRKVLINLSGTADKGYGYGGQISYQIPEGILKFEKDIKILDTIVHYKIFESDKQLTSPKTPNGSGRAGLLIKSEGAILDNTLFGYEVEPVALYFFGEVICPGIANAIRHGDESLVDTNRGGLEWRHPYNKELENVSKDILAELIKEKKENLQADGESKASEPISKLLDDISKKLSDLAKDELEEKEPGAGEIESLIIAPIFANIAPETERKFTLYAPSFIVEDEGTSLVKLTSSNENIILSSPTVKLEPSKKIPEVHKATFDILAGEKGETANISAVLGRITATCDVRIGPLGKYPSRPGQNKSGGFFRKIKPEIDEDPIQRFYYDSNGIIKVYTKFPGISNLLGDNFEKISTPEGKIVMAEIIIEAFARVVSLRRAKMLFGLEVDPVMSEMDRLRKKASDSIYNLLLRSDISQLLEK